MLKWTMSSRSASPDATFSAIKTEMIVSVPNNAGQAATRSNSNLHSNNSSNTMSDPSAESRFRFMCTVDNVKPLRQASTERVSISQQEEHSLEKLPLPKRLMMPERTASKKQELENMYFRKSLPFPVKLYHILSNPAYHEHIAWLPHGRAFKILDSKGIEDEIVPRFFRSHKFASFMRQVNGWAFTRITEGPDQNGYYHEMFLRGMPQLCEKMKRPPKGKDAAELARIESGATIGTPNFYRISQIAPLPPLAALSSSENMLVTQMQQRMDASVSISAISTRLEGKSHSPITKNEVSKVNDLGRGVTPGTNSQTDREEDLEQEVGNPFKLDGAQLDDLDISNHSISSLESSALETEELSAVDSQSGSLNTGSQLSNGAGQGSTHLSDADINYLSHQNKILLRFCKVATNERVFRSMWMTPTNKISL